MKKIIILTDIGFSKRDYHRFGIEIIKGKFEVEILDFTEWLAPRYWKIYPEKIYDCEGYRKILSRIEFENAISNDKIINAIDFLSSSEHSPHIRDLLKKKKIPITNIQNGLTLNFRRTSKEYLQKMYFLFLSPRKFLKKINQVFKSILKRKNNFFYDYVVIGGKAGLNHTSAINTKKIIKGHSFDYDIFLKLKEKKIYNQQKPYAIFLDQCLPFHPTAAFRNEKPKATKDKYFPALNNFFNNFESKTGLEIIFAAHPRSRYDLYPEFLYGRKSFLHKTPELVINSKIVLLHTSTSLSFAVLYNKPTIFLTSDEIIKSYDDFRIHSHSRSMNSLLFNIDDKNDLSRLSNEKLFFVDKKKYEEYKNNYLKYPETPEKNLWNIFLENIINESRN